MTTELIGNLMAGAGVLVAAIGVTAAMWNRTKDERRYAADAQARHEAHEERMNILTRDVFTKMDMVEYLKKLSERGE